jgi:hypothetical protein
MHLAIVRWLLAFGAVAVAVGVLIAVAVDETPDFDGDDVAVILREELRAEGGPATCRELYGARWECEVPAVNGSKLAVYEVTATSDHCWDARLIRQSDGSGAWPEAGSCVSP